jgi:PAS domain S-box-containing protein
MLITTPGVPDKSSEGSIVAAMSPRSELTKTLMLDIPPDFQTKAPGARLRKAPDLPGDALAKKVALARKGPNAHPVSNAYLQELFQGVYDAAFITDLDGTIVDANLRATQFLQYTRTELRGASLVDIVLGADAGVVNSIADNLKNDKFTLIQAQCARKDGTRFAAEISSSRLRLSPQEYLCFFIRDVSVRRETEAALHLAHDQLETQVRERTAAIDKLEHEIRERERAETELRAERNLISAVLDTTDALVMVLSPDGRIIRFNRKCEDTSGYETPEVEGDVFADIFLMEEEREYVSAAFDQLLAGEYPIQSEHHWVTKSGKLRRIAWSNTVILGPDDRVAYIVATGIDVTERRQAEAALQKAYADLAMEVEERSRVNRELEDAIVRLQEHDRARSQFVSNVSHELKTPLTSIRYVAGNLERGIAGFLPDKATPYLEMIKEDCQRLARTVEDILDLSRIEANTLHLNMKRLHFGRFVRRCVESLRLQAEAAHLSLHTETDLCHGFVSCDPHKIERTIFNLVKNAMKFNVEHGTISVVLNVYSANPQFLVLNVIDSGIGIAPEHLPHVTERFFRVGEHVSGTGLGLSISKEIVERHGGLLEVLSPPPGQQQGTQVSVYLPISEPPTLLVLSPRAQIGAALATQLGSVGYGFVAASTVDEALSVMEQSPTDILLTDWGSPDMNPVVLMGRIKSDPRLSALPVLAIVPRDADPLQRELLRGFRISELTEPFDVEEVLTKLDEVLVTRRDMES